MRYWLYVGLLCLSACSTNPREGGFIGGVQGLSTGEYDRRVADREQNLAAIQQAQASGEQENQNLNVEKAELQSRLATLQQQNARLNAELNSIEQQLAAQQAKTQTAVKQKQKLVTQQKQLRKELKQLQTASVSANNSAQIQHYEAEERRLTKEIQVLKQQLQMP